MTLLLLRRRGLALKNRVANLTGWEWGRDIAFSAAGLGLLWGLYAAFHRLLAYLASIELIGGLLLWKLTAIMMLTTFSMVAISGLLTALSTLYYSRDLRFLMSGPISLRSIFIDKSLESIFFASWMIGVVLIPYVSALVRVNGYGWPFFAAFLALMIPFLMIAASIGIAFTLVLLYLFPSSRTRDVIWLLATLSLTLVYAAVRFAQPERLIRPDALQVVAEYLNYLQAPTAAVLPSWWLTKALASLAAGRAAAFWGYGALLFCAAAAVYAGLVLLAGRLYFQGYSGAQEGAPRRRPASFAQTLESALARRLGLDGAFAPLFWKDRLTFFRDVKHWSQIMLVFGLVFVYLFSIRRLPLDNADLKSLVSFLNIGAAGFVIAALGLRFTYPAISLEGASWWVLRSSPVSVKTVMRQKFLFSAVPMTLMALVLGVVTNRLLEADPFISWLSAASLLLITWTVCAMGVGFGALFPMFEVENIHQIESSLGGFIYMAASLFYIAGTIMILSWPVQMHFQVRFGRPDAWSWSVAGYCGALLVVLNVTALCLPWILGRRALEGFEQ